MFSFLHIMHCDIHCDTKICKWVFNLVKSRSWVTRDWGWTWEPDVCRWCAATPLLAVFPFPGFTSSPRPLLETHKSPLALHSSFPPSIHLSLLSSCLEAASLTHIKQLRSRRSRSRPLFSLLPPQHFPAPVLNVHRTHVYAVRARR